MENSNDILKTVTVIVAIAIVMFWLRSPKKNTGIESPIELAQVLNLGYVWNNNEIIFTAIAPITKSVFLKLNSSNISYVKFLIDNIEDRIDKNDFEFLRNGDPGRMQDVIDFEVLRDKNSQSDRILLSIEKLPLLKWDFRDGFCSIQHYP